MRVLSFWHNSFDKIVGNSPDELLSSVTASFGAASLSGEVELEEVAGLELETAKVLASVGQGFRLRDDAKKLGWPLNTVFGGQLIMAPY